MSKTTYVLAALLVVQAGAIALRGEIFGPKADASSQKSAVFPGLTLEQVARVKIAEREGASIELARVDKGWVVASAGNYPAKADAVEKLIDKLVGLQSTGVAASSPSSHAVFEVSDRLFERDIRLLDASGGEKAHLLLGHGATGGQFVRRADSADVLRVDEMLTWQASTAPANYIETQLVKVETAKAKAITLRKGGQVTVALAKDGDAWKATTPADLEVDKAKVAELLGALSRIFAAQPVGESKPAYGLEGPEAFSIEVEMEGGARAGVTLGGKAPTAERRYARPIGSSMVAEVAEEPAKLIQKEPADLKVVAPVKPPSTPEAEQPLPGMPPGVRVTPAAPTSPAAPAVTTPATPAPASPTGQPGK